MASSAAAVPQEARATGRAEASEPAAGWAMWVMAMFCQCVMAMFCQCGALGGDGHVGILAGICRCGQVLPVCLIGQARLHRAGRFTTPLRHASYSCVLS